MITPQHIIKKTAFTLLVLFSLLLSGNIQPQQALAQVCSYEGQCVNNQVCVCNSPVNCDWLVANGGPCNAAIVGGVTPPASIAQYNLQGGGIGIIEFISKLIQLLSVIAGIFAMINFFWAGYIYITGFGDTSAHVKVRDKLVWTVVGLIVIVSSYTIGGLIGAVFFGDAGFILSPQLDGAL